MKNLKKHLYLTVFVCLLIVSQTFSQTSNQNNEVDKIFYRAYLTNSKTLWKESIKQATTQYQSSKDIQDLYLLVNAQYGLLNVTMATKDETTFDAYVDDATKNLEKLIEKDENWAEPKAILSSIYGLKMAYSPMKGIYLGPKSNSLIEKAKKVNHKSALVWKIYAGSKLFTPEMWGGDKEEAVKSFEKAILLFEAEPGKLKDNWFYLDALAFLGQAYVKTGKNDKAIAIYKKALEIEPEFNWVKYSLLPKAEKSNK